MPHDTSSGGPGDAPADRGDARDAGAITTIRGATRCGSQGVAQQPASRRWPSWPTSWATRSRTPRELLAAAAALEPGAGRQRGLVAGAVAVHAGAFLRIYDLAWVGVICFAGAAVFSLVTLPVELNASRRGLALLTQTGLLYGEQERKGVREVLTAAALTYVAGLVQSFANLMYYGSFLGGSRRRS